MTATPDRTVERPGPATTVPHAPTLPLATVPPRTAPDRLRRTLWVLLVALAVANAAVSLSPLPLLLANALGVGALGCLVALVVSRERRPR